MAIRQRDWAKEQTNLLRGLLGGKCEVCGATEDLEFDVVKPQGEGNEHHQREWSWRLSFYREQFGQGNLQLLCKRHNAMKGDMSETEFQAYLRENPEQRKAEGEK